MSVVQSAERTLRRQFLRSRRRFGVVPAALASIAAICSHGALAQTERLNAQMNATTNATAAASSATPNPDCTLIVPKNPLTAAGLATAYQLVATNGGLGACHESNKVQSAFVQAAIFDPATSTISMYNPLVIDKGSTAAIAPLVPKLPANAIVAIWFGYNGGNLTLAPSQGDDLANSSCVNGSGGSVFGQYAYCNAPAFFKAANAAITAGRLTVPALGTAKDGRPCPTVRDFFVVDQDQSDNVQTQYLLTRGGKIAQFNAANMAALVSGTVLTNGSDNRLASVALDGALGCSAWKVPDLTNPGTSAPSLATDELSARVNQATPVAQIPAGDPMAQVDGNSSRTKVNLYRAGVDQSFAQSLNDADTARYCREIMRSAPARIFNTTTRGFLVNAASPDAGAANSLFTFLAQRLVAAYGLLDCRSLIGQSLPITLTTNSAGVTTNATVSVPALKSAVLALSASHASDLELDSSARSQQ
jgi:hypothetical protein